MNQRSFNNDGTTYERISKFKAMSLWKKDIPVYIDSCNMRPFNEWGTTFLIPCQEILTNIDMTFNTYVRNFEWYNCDYERGYYAAFYVQQKYL